MPYGVLQCVGGSARPFRCRLSLLLINTYPLEASVPIWFLHGERAIDRRDSEKRLRLPTNGWSPEAARRFRFQRKERGLWNRPRYRTRTRFTRVASLPRMAHRRRLILRELESILSSPFFRTSNRSKQFLSYVVQHTLAGQPRTPERAHDRSQDFSSGRPVIPRGTTQSSGFRRVRYAEDWNSTIMRL